jgi:hypothetical protein
LKSPFLDPDSKEHDSSSRSGTISSRVRSRYFSGPIEWVILLIWAVACYLVTFTWHRAGWIQFVVVWAPLILITGALRAKYGTDDPGKSEGITPRGRRAAIVITILYLAALFLVIEVWQPVLWVFLFVVLLFSQLNPMVSCIFWKAKK